MAIAVDLTTSLWHAKKAEPLLEITLGQMLEGLAREFPDRVGFVEISIGAKESRRWTYAELYESATRVARSLLRIFSPGDRVAVWAPNCAEWVLLQHGAAMAGMVLVTVNPAYRADELRYVLEASKAAGLFHSDVYRDSDMTAVARRLKAELPALRLICPFSEWTAFNANSNPGLKLPTVQPQDMIQIQFTSGTTGKPKGACLHHRGVINASRFAAQRAGFPEGGVWATAMPLFHVGGCAGSELGAMSHGGTFVLQQAFDAGDMLRTIELERVNHLHAVPTMVISLLNHPDLKQRDVSTLRTLMSGGSPVPAALVEQAKLEMGCNFTITFGQTELNGVICQTFPDDEITRQTSTVGQPSPWMDVKIADPGSGDVQPLGQPGEIWARGYQVMHGYYNLPAGIESAITNDGWLKTGDLASMDASGYLRITGRLKDCIIRGGENIYPREIEDVLVQHPAVREACVVGVPDKKWGETVAAVIRLQPDVDAPATEELHFFCRERLAAYKTPVAWYYVEQFPTTTSGKVQKFEVKDLILRGAIVAQPFQKPVSTWIKS